MDILPSAVLLVGQLLGRIRVLRHYCLGTLWKALDGLCTILRISRDGKEPGICGRGLFQSMSIRGRIGRFRRHEGLRQIGEF